MCSGLKSPVMPAKRVTSAWVMVFVKRAVSPTLMSSIVLPLFMSRGVCEPMRRRVLGSKGARSSVTRRLFDSPSPGVLLAEGALEHLAAVAGGERVEEGDVLGDFVAGETGARELDEILGRGRRAVLQYDERLADLAPPLVRHADDGDGLHGGVRLEEALDLSGVHVLGPADEHLLLS